MKLPVFFENYFTALMDAEEYEHFKASFDGRRHLGLRVNTLKVAPEAFEKLYDQRLSRIPWVSEGFYYEEGSAPGKHPYYHAGLYYIQEPSAMMPAQVLSPAPGEKVLDLCAAPGGKTTHLGIKMQNRGLVVSNDISPKRVKALVKNVELMGLTNTLVVNETPQRLLGVFPEYFDKILLDVPCSGEGMFRKDREAVQSYTRFKSSECVAMQRDIFEQAIGMLRPGGTMVYSTCTFNPDENERNMEHFIKQYGISVKSVDPWGGWERSRGEWTESGDQALSGGLRLWPHKAMGEGHFVCLLEKPGQAHDSERTGDACLTNAYTSSDAEKAAEVFFAFAEDHMHTKPAGLYHLRGSSLYLLPPYLGAVPAIRWEKAGLYVGEVQKGRFEPSQSLILSSTLKDFKRVLDLSARDHDVMRYLKGETLMTEGEKGYTCVAVDGFPLGWGKQENGMLKNLYSKGWRMM